MTQETLLLDNSEPKSFSEFYIGEGKKYTDNEGLAKAYYNADKHIKTVETENQEYRQQILDLKAQAATAAKLEDLIMKYDNQRQQQLASNEQPPVKEVINQPAYKPEQIESLVSDLYQKNKTRDQEKANFDTVKAKLIERFGNNYPSVVADQIKELGISAEELDSMARRSPNLVYRTLGVDKQPESFQSPPRSQGSFRPTVAPANNKMSYYMEMKKTKPRVFSDPKIQKQMETDALALGESFFDV